VLDARPAAPLRFQLQTLVLAHSWAAWAASEPLDVIVVGKPRRSVEGRLRELGIELAESAPHPLEPISKSSNKLLGLRASSDGPVLLIDNDACFLEDVSNDLDGPKIRTTIAARAPITPEQWKRIRIVTGLEPLEQEWVPLLAELKARRFGSPPEVQRKLYLSSAVSWILQPAAFEELWAAGIEAIAGAFDGHSLRSYAVCGSDQAGFAVGVAQHGGLELLPPTYNYRPVCFRLGLPDPKILHFGELGNVKRTMLPFSQLLNRWWERRILLPIRRLTKDAAEWPSDHEQTQLLDEAASIRDRVLDLGREAGLDAFDFSSM
jgi:hypothetical protein